MSLRAYCIEDAAKETIARIEELLGDDRRIPTWVRRDLQIETRKLKDALARPVADPEWIASPGVPPHGLGLRLVHARYDGESREEAYSRHPESIDSIRWQHVTEFCCSPERSWSRSS